jgi:uncharacterized membrane protein
MFELGGSAPSFAVHGGGDSGGMAGLMSDVLSFIETLVSLSPSQMFAELMPGISHLSNVHPLLVHFPIALLSLFFVIDTSAWIFDRPEWRKTASTLLYLGSGLSVLTVIAGLMAAASIPHGDDVHEIMEHHEHLAISTSLLSLALAGWHFIGKSVFQGPAAVLHGLLSVILMSLLILTADLGGLMVYGHGVAVQPVMALQQDAALAHQHGDEPDDHHVMQPEADAQTEIVPAPSSVPSMPSHAAPADAEAGKIHVHRDGSQHHHDH